MFQVKLLPQDLKEKARLERRKALEDERRKRIFNPKERMIGVDIVGIQKQIEEKKREEEITNAIEKRYQQSQINASKVADDVDRSISENRRMLYEELNLYWKTRQRKEDRREYSLNLPLKIIEDESNLGVSSGQVFGGEDLNKKNREMIQIEQQKNWLIQQMSERKQTGEKVKLAEKIYQDGLNSRENRAMHLNDLERQCRREIHRATMAYNEALARENKFLNQVQKEKAQQDNQMEIFNAINSDLLTENPEVSQSNLGQNKVIQYQYKGMSEEERLEVRQSQLRQIQQNKINMDAETTFLRKWEQYNKSLEEILEAKSRLNRREQREYNRALMEENKILSREKKIRQRDEIKIAASNFTTTEFLNKFNQSSR